MSLNLNSIFTDITNGIGWFANQSWIYPGLIIAVAIGLTFYLGFFQIRKMRQMSKCFFKIESGGDKSMSPLKIFLTSLSGRFGLGNIIGVGVAIFAGGPGVVIWMIIISAFCMSIAFVESSLSQIFHERDSANPNEKLYRGGTPYYLYKGLGRGFKWAAILYVIFSVLAKGVFIITTTTSSISYIGFFTFLMPDSFFNAANPTSSAMPTVSPFGHSGIIIWMFVAVYFIITTLIIMGGIKKVIKISSKVMPITFFLFLSFIVLYCCFNYNYFPAAIKAIFVGFVNPRHAIPGVAGGTVAWSIAQTIKSGATRGIFAHEAGQGSTTFISSVSKVDNPIRMGYGQSLAVVVDVALICAASGVFFTMATIKSHDIVGNVFLVNGADTDTAMQASFTTWVTYHFLPQQWTVWLVSHNAGIVNRLFCYAFFVVIFLCGFSILLGALVISEYSVGFLIRNASVKKQNLGLYIIRIIILIGIVLSPLINMLSKSVFAIADLAICACFITNMFALVLLAPLVKRVQKDFNVQHNNLVFNHVKNIDKIPLPAKFHYLINFKGTIKYKVLNIEAFTFNKQPNVPWTVPRKYHFHLRLIPKDKESFKFRWYLWKVAGKMDINLTFDPTKLAVYNREFKEKVFVDRG